MADSCRKFPKPLREDLLARRPKEAAAHGLVLFQGFAPSLVIRV